MAQSETNNKRLWQVEARITLPRFTQKGKDGALPPTLTPINVFQEQCLDQKDGIEIWLRCDFPESIVSIQNFAPNTLVAFQIITGQEDKIGQDMGFLQPKQFPYKLVVKVLSDRPEHALNMVIERLDLLTDILTFQLQYPVKIVGLRVFDSSENLRKGDQRECIIYNGTPYYRIAKDAGALYSDPVFMRIDPYQIKTELPEEVEAGLRWFAKGLSAFSVVDKFSFYWIALEILISPIVSSERRFFFCQKCGYEIQKCPKCDFSTKQHPIIKQKIKSFVVDLGRKTDLFEKLWQTRQLFHGRVRLKDPQEIEDISRLVSELKAIVVDAIKINLGIMEKEPPFSPTQGPIAWSSMWIHGFEEVDP
jgi:hypothetical protein